MANNYRAFSFAIDLPSNEWAQRLRQPLEALQRLNWKKPDDVPERFPALATDPGKTLLDYLKTTYDDADWSDSHPGLDSLNVELEINACRLYINSHSMTGTDFGCVDTAASLVAALQDLGAAPDPSGFEYADYCDKPRPGEFGGGAVAITKEGMEFHSTSEWLNQQMALPKAGTQPVPVTDGEPLSEGDPSP